MLKNKRAVTAISYGLISALIIVLGLGAFAATGTKLSSVFSFLSNSLSVEQGSVGSSLVSPNPVLTAEQQSEISNAASEIAAGTASASCLQNMNSNAYVMVANNASCLGPGYGIAPPALPIMVNYIFNQYTGSYVTYEVEQDGEIYAETDNASPSNINDSTALSFSNETNASGAYFNDGYAPLDTVHLYGYTTCGNGNGNGMYQNGLKAAISENGVVICSGEPINNSLGLISILAW